ncbi:MAG: hypothetical protein GX483_04850 [Actinomycetaceae bacterium]|nr:hypothetical protein [Actinomycetaceae bacterium]
MSTLSFELIFTGPVRVGTGVAGNGMDEIVDQEHPLSETALKGVLRDAARVLLPGTSHGDDAEDHPFVNQVFGEPGVIPCPWNFSVTTPDPAVKNRAGIKIGEKGVVEDGALQIKEEIWFKSASRVKLEIYQRGNLTQLRASEKWTSENIKNAHLALLHLAARLTDKVGQRKTRGMGWVSFAMPKDNRRDVAADIKTLAEVKELFAQEEGAK